MSNNNSNYEYVDESLDCVIRSLSHISDREYQLRVWHRAEGPEVDWFDEGILMFDTQMDSFRSFLREGKTSLNPTQVKAVLRLHVMTLRFRKILPVEDESKSWSDQQLDVINHPYWQKILKQAGLALSLLSEEGTTDKRAARTYGSIQTRTASRRPNLDNRFSDKIKVFGNRNIRKEQWKRLEDFWDSVNGFDLVARKFFDGMGRLSGRPFRPFMAFHGALDKLCEPYEKNGGDLQTILSDPLFNEVEQTAKSFLRSVKNEALRLRRRRESASVMLG